MADLKFYTNPRSRGQTVRWMLEELGQPYDTEVLDYGTSMKAEPYLSINPMGKVPAIVHKGKVVTEAAAICCYLADAFPEAGLAPDPQDRAEYYRWIFFCSGPVEAAFTAKAMGWQVPPERQIMAGFGTYEATMATLSKALDGRTYIAGNRFTAADLYVGALVNFMLEFKLLEPTPVFTDYAKRMTDRDAYRRARDIDAKLTEEAQAAQPAPQPA